MTIDSTLPYIGDNMRACCQRAERDSAPESRWVECPECGTVLVNIDGRTAAPAVVEVALFDLESSNSGSER